MTVVQARLLRYSSSYPCITLWYYSLYNRINLVSLQTRISSSIYVPLGAKTILSHSHIENDSSPIFLDPIVRSGSRHIFVLFKQVSLIWINYLETLSCWDNTSCYYTCRILYRIDPQRFENHLPMAWLQVIPQLQPFRPPETKRGG